MFLLFTCALIIAILGMDSYAVVADLSERDIQQSTADFTLAVRKVWLQCFVHALKHLEKQLPFLWSVLSVQWPWACVALLVVVKLLWVGMRAPRQSQCTMFQALQRSWTKLIYMFFSVVLPVLLFYGDLASDALVIAKFWKSEQYDYLILNIMAILAGLVTSTMIGTGGMGESTDALQGIKDHIGIMTFLHLIPLYVLGRAFCEFSIAKFASYKSDAFDNRLRDTGLIALLASSTLGETFGEAMLSSFVQLYAALRHGQMHWPSLLVFSVPWTNIMFWLSLVHFVSRDF